MVVPEENEKNRTCKHEPADRVIVTYYTDPLCCWSWAFEPVWDQFCTEYRGLIDCRYVMGGMIPDWKRFSDPLNSVSVPVQMGPVWMQASVITHVPMDYHIWHTDPPASSYPACMAVKNAFLQGQAAGEAYLRAVRRAVMTERRNVARQEVLTDIAMEVDTQTQGVFDASEFTNPARQSAARDAFRQDLQTVAVQKIGRFPTLTLVDIKGRGVIMTGYRPIERLREGMELMAQGGGT